jgi:hypothetical protein
MKKRGGDLFACLDDGQTTGQAPTKYELVINTKTIKGLGPNHPTNTSRARRRGDVAYRAHFGPSAMSQLSPLSAPERMWIILKMADVGCPRFCGPSGIYFSHGHPHIVTMTQRQKSSLMPHKTKAERRQMLTEAVRNTQPSAENGSKGPPKAKKDRG